MFESEAAAHRIGSLPAFESRQIYALNCPQFSHHLTVPLKTKNKSGAAVAISRSDYETMRTVVCGMVGNAPNRDVLSHGVDGEHG
jgi:hypothetical protein